MASEGLSPAFLAFLATIRGKRARIVIQHILEYGFISTEDLELRYGYKHPPRAIRDVREQGVWLEAYTLKNQQGKPIAAYRFGPAPHFSPQYKGRQPVAKKVRDRLFEEHHDTCQLCQQKYPRNFLQLDHRIPFEIAGESPSQDPATLYQVVCRSCNRAKSWTCEQCDNLRGPKAPESCACCYWASPAAYTHVALQDVRRVELVWVGSEAIAEYERLRLAADSAGLSLVDYLLARLRQSKG
jgi:hypothetical protein